MLSKEAKAVLKKLDITKEELEPIYRDMVKKAKSMWREGCIEEYSSWGMPKLRIQIGINTKGDYTKLLSRAYWHYSHMMGDSPDWYFATIFEILQETYEPAEAGDYLYEDTYYRRTGNISDRAKKEYVSCCPVEIKSLEEVIEEIGAFYYWDLCEG